MTLDDLESLNGRNARLRKKIILRSPPEKFQWRQIHTVSGKM